MFQDATSEMVGPLIILLHRAGHHKLRPQVVAKFVAESRAEQSLGHKLSFFLSAHCAPSSEVEHYYVIYDSEVGR